jgi:MFS family permease
MPSACRTCGTDNLNVADTPAKLVRAALPIQTTDFMNPRAARYAVFITFLLHGMLLGSWVPHIPLVKDALAIGPAKFGLALLSLPVGSVVAMPLTGMMVSKYGSGPLTLLSGVLFCLLVLGPPHANSMFVFVPLGVLLGAAIGAMDVAMNAQGLAVERFVRVPTISIFHGAFSLGALVGTLFAASLMRSIGPTWQLLAMSTICLLMQLWAARYYLPASVDKGQTASSLVWPTRATLALGMLCFLALMIEGSVLDWGAIYLREKFSVDAAFAALAFGTYQGGMAVARFTGDYLRHKFGAVPLTFGSALLTAAGTTAGLYLPSATLTIIAFVFAGLGVGNIAPVLFAGGGRLERDAPGRGIAAVATMGYTGFLAAPPLIGMLAQVTNLQVGLSITILAALVIAVFARQAKAADGE